MTHKGHLFSDLIQHRKLLASGLYHITPEDLLSYVMLFTPSSNIISTKKTTNIYGKECFQSNAGAVIGSGLIHKSIITDVAENSCSSHWDYIFEEGAMFMHDGMEQGIYLDVKRDFCAIFFDNVSEFNQVTFDSFLPLYFRSISKQLR
ncbi:hypothetical protein JCM19233_4433 [Vibrio astriarenae]|nr:hypothetical protein JCM19233_4433 [Vibrio sp. C7]